VKHTAQQIRIESQLDANLQYTYVTTMGQSIMARARTPEGRAVYVERKYTPIYYLPVADPKNADAEGYDGTPLMSHMCDSIREGKAFVEEHPDAFGSIQPEYMLLADTYGDKDVPFDIDRLYTFGMDIEVARDPERGYAPVEDPFNPITTISVLWRHMGKMGIVVYGTKDYTPEGDETYIQCDDEDDLLRRFIADFRSGGDYPDIVTGWNIQNFDWPYLVNRSRLRLGDEATSRLSPFGRIEEKKAIMWGQEALNVDIRGIAILDYYEVYRKFRLVQRENYKLDYIAQVELKKGKINYKELRSLDKLYAEDYQKFVRYNIQDVVLVDELENARKLIALIVALTYTAKCNFLDTFKQVRLWDVMIYHRLRALGQQIPPRRQESKTEQYEGAFVKDPLVGFHEWIVSYDVASMYPHIIREWNLSPEMIVDQKKLGTVDQFLDRKVSFDHIDPKYAISVNGALTRKDKEGFLPNMLKALYEERTRFKKLAKKAKDAAAHESDPLKKRQLEKDAAAYDNQQQVRKVNLNSAYGALGSNYFRFYDVRLAEAVTVTGQLAIRWVAKDINAFLNKVNKTTNEDYIIASDTDSVYMRMEAIAKKLNPTGIFSTEQLVEGMDAFCKKFLQPLIDKSFTELATYLRVYHPCLSMVRDVIADKAIWTAKKRYIMNVHDSEGLRYDKPQLKMMGIEAIKSSTPGIVRTMITDALTLFMKGKQEDVWALVDKSRTDFYKAKFEDIAFPRSVNGLKKYAGQTKGVPIHVRGALAFNEMLERQNLTTVYSPIHEGEKITFAHLRQPNVFFSHVLSIPSSGAPPEWNIEQWLDYDAQFSKTFIEPLQAILSCAGWTVKYTPSLFD
jgi:DNA polymerase elongation subunit (family B)